MKIKKSSIILTLFIIVFFKPMAINSLLMFSSLNRLWDYGRIIVCIFVLVKTLRLSKLSHSCISIILFEVLCLGVTIINGGDFVSMLVQSASVVGFSLLTYTGIKEYKVQYFTCLFRTLSVLIVIQLISMILFPDGLGYDTVYYNKIFFLASKNGLIKYIFPTLVSGICLCGLKKEKKVIRSVIGISFICVYIAISMGSTTTEIGILVLLGLYGLYKWKLHKCNINVVKGLFLCIFLFASLGSIWGSSTGVLQILGTVVDGVKFENYSSRIVIWNKALELISSSPILGYGMPNGAGHILINSKYVYAHNGFLEIILYSGIIGLFIVFHMIYYCIFAIRSNMTPFQFCVSAAIMGFLIMMITESHIHTVSFWAFFVMLDLMRNGNRIIE
ncbi:MAG: hypothetical protein EOM11_02870 [Erysipelotrichia bacterium]|nr:hypothetical protein [Erysipelotrichia bacterium]